MVISKADRLADALDELLATSADVEAAAVVSFDGLTMASALPPDIDEPRMGAMSAALLGLGEQATLGLGRGTLSQLFVEGEHGYVFLMSAGDQAVLAIVTNERAKIGFVLFEMRRTARTVGALLSGHAAAHPDPDTADGALVHAPETTPEHEIEWAPAAPEADPLDTPAAYTPRTDEPYRPGPVPPELVSDPYYLGAPVHRAPDDEQS